MKRKKFMWEINGALLDVLSLQERIEGGKIKNSMDADKILRLCGRLQGRADIIRALALDELRKNYRGGNT